MTKYECVVQVFLNKKIITFFFQQNNSYLQGQGLVEKIVF